MSCLKSSGPYVFRKLKYQHLIVKYTKISAVRGMNIHTSMINKFMSALVKFRF